MSCEKFEEMINASWDGELNSSETDQLNLHLQDCQHCGEFFNAMRRIKGLFDIHQEITLSESFDQKFFARLGDLRSGAQKKATTRSWWEKRVLIPAPVAYAVIAVILFLTGIIFYIKKPVTPQPSAQFQSTTFVEESSQKIRKIKITKDDITVIQGQNHF